MDKALQRLAASGLLRRVDRGLYCLIRPGLVPQDTNAPDYVQVLNAISRRDQARVLIDGAAAAHELGFTTAVPARIVVRTDARRRSILVGKQAIEFRQTAPSKLYWAGRPAMRLVQALRWLKDLPSFDRDSISRTVVTLLADPKDGAALRDDLRQGLGTLPAWMQDLLRPLLPEPKDSPARLTHQRVPKVPPPVGKRTGLDIATPENDGGLT